MSLAAGSPVVERRRLDALAIAVMLFLCMLWGVQQVASKVALSQGIPPTLQATLRSVLAGPLLLAWLYARRGKPGLASLLAADGTLWPGLATGVVFAAEFLLLFAGVRLTSASHAVILLFTGGFFTAAGAHLLLPAERLDLNQAGGFLLAFLGVTVTVGWKSGPSSLPGDLLVLGSASLWGLTTLLVKLNPALHRCSSEKVLAYQLFGALPFLLAATLLAGELHIPTATPVAWLSLLFQGAVIAFASYLTWFWLVARYPAGRLAAFSLLTPIFGVVAAALLLDEPLSPSLILGVTLVAAGLAVVNRQPA